jgi:hypothetical protein
MTVYAINKFDQKFVKSDSRKMKTPLWISLPTSFDSTGYHALHDEFDGATACMLYGAWCILLKIAAVAPIRGQLGGQKGEPYSFKRLERDSRGVPAEVFEKLFEWAIRVGWLVPADTIQTVPQTEKTDENETLPEAPRQRPGNLPEVSRKSPGDFQFCPTTGQDRTGQDTTQQDRTGQDNQKRPARPGPKSGSDPNAETQTLSSVVADLILDNPDLQELTRSRVAPDPSEPQEMATSVFTPLKASDVISKPPMWWAAVWYKRQLASPDPVLKGSNAAEAAVVVALAMSLAKVPDAQVKSSRTSMFISLLTKGCHGLPSRAAPSMPAAIAMVRETLARSAAQQPVETP